MGRRCKSAMLFNKDEKWYLSEATRLLQEATKLIEAKDKVASKKTAVKKSASPRQKLYEAPSALS
jgi:hypothetical protein